MAAPGSTVRSNADLFLKVTAEGGAPFKGESKDTGHGGPSHVDEIEISGFSWGAESSADAGSGAATRHRQFKRLRVFKNIDLATVNFFKAIGNNHHIKEAILTARNSAQDGSHVEFLIIRINKARVVKWDIEYPDPATGLGREVVEFAFEKIHMKYTPQAKDTLARGALEHEDTWNRAS
jgi:type VI secretion system Hcp family effector